jgi:hypothetical protein
MKTLLFEPLNLNQKVVLAALAFVLGMPMLFVVFSNQFTKAQGEFVCFANMILAPIILILSFRTWVQRIK